MPGAVSLKVVLSALIVSVLSLTAATTAAVTFVASSACAGIRAEPMRVTIKMA